MMRCIQATSKNRDRTMCSCGLQSPGRSQCTDHDLESSLITPTTLGAAFLIA